MDCLFITESWLNNHVTAGLLDPKHEFVIFRNDRLGLAGGGVCAIIRKSLNARKVEIAQLDSRVEMLCLDVYGANVINRFFWCTDHPTVHMFMIILAAPIMYLMS